VGTVKVGGFADVGCESGGGVERHREGRKDEKAAQRFGGRSVKAEQLGRNCVHDIFSF
jgi:hypothetical protein